MVCYRRQQTTGFKLCGVRLLRKGEFGHHVWLEVPPGAKEPQDNYLWKQSKGTTVRRIIQDRPALDVCLASVNILDLGRWGCDADTLTSHVWRRHDEGPLVVVVAAAFCGNCFSCTCLYSLPKKVFESEFLESSSIGQRPFHRTVVCHHGRWHLESG